MMEEIVQTEQALLDAIRSSKALRRYEEYREQIAQSPEKKALMNAYRMHAFRAANYEYTDDRLAQNAHLLEERENICKDPVIEGFLSSELEICRILQRICRDIVSVVDLEVDALEQL